MDDTNQANEINLKNIKKLLTELSINLGFDLEPAKEIINIKHSHLNGISYPIFKECLFEWLEKQERILSNTIFIDETPGMNNFENNFTEINENKNSNINNLKENQKFSYGPEYNINMIILQRSLYILKRKFEIYDKQINEIYKKYSEQNKIEYIIEIKNFIILLSGILKIANFSLTEIKKNEELFRAEVINMIQKNKIKKIVEILNLFMSENRNKYNNLIKEKKEKAGQKIKSEINNENIEKSDVNIDDINDEIDELTQNKLQFLFIEILPLIIADFVHENSSIIILDSNEELKFELRTLFDNEILQRLGERIKYNIEEEKTIKLKELLFEKLNLEKNIKTYEDLYLKKHSEKENTVFIQEMLKKLNKQKIILENKIKNIQEDNETINNFEYNLNNSNLDGNINQILTTESIVVNNNLIKSINNNNNNINTSKNVSIMDESSLYRKNNISKIIPKKYLTNDEIRTNALKEIFLFYSRQHSVTGPGVTFDDISYKQNHMNLGEFNKFCVEFKILVKKERLIEVFKKTSSDNKQINFDEFVLAVRSISVKVNDEKKDLLLRRIYRMKRELKKFGIDYVDLEKKNSKNYSPRLGLRDDVRDLVDEESNKEHLKGFMERYNMRGANNNEEKDVVDENLENIKNRVENTPNIQNLENINNNVINNNENNTLINEINENNNSLESNENSKTHSDTENNNNNNINEGSPIKPLPIKKQRPKLVRKASLIFPGPQEILMEIPKYKYMLQELKNKSYSQLLEELFCNLELDNEKLYRNKMKGFILPFFYSHSKQNPDGSLILNNKKQKKLDPRSTEEIRKILKDKKEDKENLIKERERKEKLKFFEQRNKINQLNYFNQNYNHNFKENLLKLKDGEGNVTSIANLNEISNLSKKQKSYVTLNKKKEVYQKEKESKLTWDQLENLNPTHFITNREDDFNPSDLIDEDLFDSDNEDLFLNINIGINKNKNLNTESSQRITHITYPTGTISNYNNAALLNNNKITNKEKSYLSVHKNKKLNKDNQNIINNNDRYLNSNSVEKVDKSIDYSINNNSIYAGKNYNNSLNKSISPVNNINKHNYYVQKTEQKAKQLEKEWEEKQAKVLNNKLIF